MARSAHKSQVSIALVTEKVAAEDNMALHMLAQAGQLVSEGKDEVTTGNGNGSATAEKVVAVAVSDEDMTKLSGFGTNKSAMIRYLASCGYKTSPIAKALSVHFGKDVKYQQVRNVLIQSTSVR